MAANEEMAPPQGMRDNTNDTDAPNHNVIVSPTADADFAAKRRDAMAGGDEDCTTMCASGTGPLIGLQ